MADSSGYTTPVATVKRERRPTARELVVAMGDPPQGSGGNAAALADARLLVELAMRAVRGGISDRETLAELATVLRGTARVRTTAADVTARAVEIVSRMLADFDDASPRRRALPPADMANGVHAFILGSSLRSLVAIDARFAALSVERMAVMVTRARSMRHRAAQLVSDIYVEIQVTGESGGRSFAAPMNRDTVRKRRQRSQK
jgi:hypothetical protein